MKIVWKRTQKYPRRCTNTPHALNSHRNMCTATLYFPLLCKYCKYVSRTVKQNVTTTSNSGSERKKSRAKAGMLGRKHP